MVGMADTPDKFYDLAIVDPPYGIGNFTQSDRAIKYSSYEWNESVPTGEYFNELRRVSRKQIIWGANYYNCFTPEGGAIIWHKDNPHPTMSGCEIASVSGMKRVTYIKISHQQIITQPEWQHRIHPCQKPIALYKWLLTNYAKPGQTILDTHLGSGSPRIAAYDLGFDFTGYELDKDYFDAQEKRFADHIAQPRLFEPVTVAEQENLFA
jgi:site-specific DNA-methyltransferase (adenine-specific)